ncbi:MAG TPA: hypothetical protein VFU02_03625 [Polyangiaceae bacterium]|nr:hypothetical protein [Polyangiaceae bacterium]
MIDENAFGILISDFDLEDDEYRLEPDEFGERTQRFHDVVFEHVAEHALAPHTRALDFGHAIFFEFGEGDQVTAPLGWLKTLRGVIAEAGLTSVGILTHGSRWVDEEAGVEVEVEQRYIGSVAVARVSNSSEPLRRALYADTASRPHEDDSEGWGPGLYADTEAIEALGLTPKNQPTGLSVAGATFFRISR